MSDVTNYRVKVSGADCIITMTVTFNDGEQIEHVKSIPLLEAAAICQAITKWNNGD